MATEPDKAVNFDIEKIGELLVALTLGSNVVIRAASNHEAGKPIAEATAKSILDWRA